MTWIDGAALTIILLSAAISAVRGFVREVLGVGAWVGAGIAAMRFFPLIQPEIASILPETMKNFALYGAMAAVFIVVLIILSLVSALIGGLVRESALSGLDHSLGLVFGAARGAVIVCAAYSGATVLVTLVPKQYQPKVDPPPGAPAPAAATLMQQPVAGSALQTQPAAPPQPAPSPPPGLPQVQGGQ